VRDRPLQIYKNKSSDDVDPSVKSDWHIENSKIYFQRITGVKTRSTRSGIEVAMEKRISFYATIPLVAAALATADQDSIISLCVTLLRNVEDPLQETKSGSL